MPNPSEPADRSGSLFAQKEQIAVVNVAEEMKNSFLDYSMSVIIARALPDVRDGLKPSQRRLLYAMYRDLNLLPGRKHLKCARIVGETMGKYHPHGDQAIYPTLVHMAQPWAMREPLIDGQGNFGSIEDDPPAAMRYTEARLTHLGALLMEDMDKDTVDFAPTYDEEHVEPVVLPAAFPNLLVNGATGIAVGMATNIPPHNLSEVIDAVCALIDNPRLKPIELTRYMKGPDFPTGGVICGRQGIRRYFETGRGSVKIRGKVGVERLKGNREQIVITEIPFNVNRPQLVERIANLVNEGRIKEFKDISAIRDESDENTRVVIEIKRDAIPKVIINNLFKYTPLETTFAVNSLAIDQGRPKTLNVKELILCYIEHRREVVLRRTRFLLRKAEQRAEILEGYIVALANLDDFIRIIRKSRNREEAKIKLLAYDWSRKQVEKWGILIRDPQRLSGGRYALTERQADAILDLRLYQLTAMEIDKIRDEYNKIIENIRDLLDILAREDRVYAIIKEELQQVKEKRGNPRRTQIVDEEKEFSIEDLVANESVIITMTHRGLIKRTNISSYRAQRRGGKGVIGMSTRNGVNEDDFIEQLFAANTHDYLMFFTNTGRVYVERVLEIPDMGRAARGRSIANLLELRSGEKIAALIRVPRAGGQDKESTWEQPCFVFFATRNGIVKKTALSGFAHVKRGGIIAINIQENDSLIEAKITSGHNDIVLVTRKGMSIRFSEEDVRPMGRAAAGVRGISLQKGDAVVGMAVVEPDTSLLVVGAQGVGKRTALEEYRRQSRGGKGVITLRITERTGDLVGALPAREGDEIMLITAGGQMVRIRAAGIREIGRNTQGVKLINLRPGDRVQDIARVAQEEHGEEPAESAQADAAESPQTADS